MRNEELEMKVAALPRMYGAMPEGWRIEVRCQMPPSLLV